MKHRHKWIFDKAGYEVTFHTPALIEECDCGATRITEGGIAIGRTACRVHIYYPDNSVEYEGGRVPSPRQFNALVQAIAKKHEEETNEVSPR